MQSMTVGAVLPDPRPPFILLPQQFPGGSAMTFYPFTIAAVLLALAVYFWSVFLVGRARGRYQVQAPSVSGAPEFERILRAQQNTVEQLVLFLPLIVVAAILWGDRWAALYGLVWSVGRILYIVTYAQDAQRRSLGFLLSAGVSLLVLLALAGTLASASLAS